MAARKLKREEVGWTVLQIKGKAAVAIGHVYARNEQAALKAAFEKYDIRPELQKRIIVRPWD